MAGPIEAIHHYVTSALDLRGRATRSQFWWSMLTVFALSVLCAYSDGQRLLNDPTAIGPDQMWKMPTIWLSLLTLVPTFTITIRRLHDTGRSGFWYLIVFVPLIGGIWMLILMLTKSDHSNRWGPAPGVDLRPLHEPQQQTSTSKNGRKSSAWDSYAALAQADQSITPEAQAARKAEISDYYRRHILKQPA